MKTYSASLQLEPGQEAIDLLENFVVEQYLEIGADFLFAKPDLQIQARA